MLAEERWECCMLSVDTGAFREAGTRGACSADHAAYQGPPHDQGPQVPSEDVPALHDRH